MRCELKCVCGAKAYTHGTDEHDVNAFIVQDNEPIEWQGGDTHCQHEDFSVVDAWHDDDEDW